MRLNIKISYAVFVLLVMVMMTVTLCNGASLNIAEQKRYRQLIEGQGLYTPEDDVIIFTASNFKSQLYGQKHAMLLEFYNSWCGFCQKFAPTWKALASDLKAWKNIVEVGVFDCSDDDNGPICREFEIMHYPTIRYFHPNYLEAPNSYGADVQKGSDVLSQRKELVIKMIEEQKQNRLSTAPDLQPYVQPDLSILFKSVPSNVNIVFMLMELPDSLMGPELAMDLQKVTNVAIKYSLYNNTALTNNLGIQQVPKMIVQERNGQPNQFASGLHTREGFKMAIFKYLKEKNIPVPELEVNTGYMGAWEDVSVPPVDEIMELREEQAIKQKVKAMGDVVFQMDLETALRYSLRDISNTKHINGEKFEALKKYLSVLAKYFPLGRKGKQFLAELRDRVVNRQTASIDGTELEPLVKNAQNAQPPIYSSKKDWMGCRGSNRRYRGYPCGIWTLFHYLTVNAAELSAGTPNENTNEVLEAMLGYVKHFFGCAHCSQHFQEMAAKKGLLSVPSLDSGIMWLWMAHNLVNKRLAGDDTDDPEHRKQQFPSAQRCPTCRNQDSSWNYPEVSNYLRNMYANRNVRYLGSDTGVLHEGLRLIPAPTQSTGWPLGQLDTSMCFLLYIACFSLLLFIIRIFLKRGYRKKMYVHDLLGKV